jgi:type III secretion protein T
MELDHSLLVDLQTALITLALVTPRVQACMMFLPTFPWRSMSELLRHSAAIAITLPATVPTFEFVRHTPPDLMLATVLACKEALIGAMFGVVLATPMWLAQSIGSVLDVQRSPIPTQGSGAATSGAAADASATGTLLLQAVTLVMVQSGLFAALVRILLESYAFWPAFDLFPPFDPGHFDVVIKRFGEFFWHLVVYGGPVLIPLLLIDLAFAIVGVFTPNLQVSSASSPIKCLVGLFIMLVYWPTFSHYLAGDFAHLLDFTTELMQATRAAP